MVNKKITISTPVSTGPVVSTPSSGTAGVSSNASSGTTGGSNTGASSAGGGSVGGTATAGAVPLKQPSKAFRKELTAVTSGVGTQLPSTTTINVNGQSMNQASILTVLQAVLLLYGNVDAAVQAAKSNRLVLQAALPAAHQFVVGLKAALVALFGKGNPALVAFGFSGTKPRQLTPEQKTARAAKAKATRQLRGTMGARQKAGVAYQGTVAVQTTLSGTPAAGGPATPASTSTTGGASTTPAASGSVAPGTGSTSSSGA